MLFTKASISEIVMGEHESRESVIFENNGQKIFAVLHLPKGVLHAPAVVFCHGLAGHKSGKYRVYVELAEALTKEGIAALRLDYRGCGDSEGLFYDMTPQDHISDILKGVDYLVNHKSVNPSLIGFMGRSFGGAAAVIAAAKFGKARSIALWCPMFSGAQWHDQWNLVETNAMSEKSQLEMMQVGGQQGSLVFFENFFQIDVKEELLKLNNVPLLHIHGEVDLRVDLSHADAYKKVRNGSHVESKFIRLSNSDHDFSDMLERVEALSETCSWFSQTLR